MSGLQFEEGEEGREVVSVSACRGGDEPERAQEDRGVKRGWRDVSFEAINQRCC